MPKTPPKLSSEQRSRNKMLAKPGQRVRFAIGRKQTEHEGRIKEFEDQFVLVHVPGVDYLMRVYPSTCFPINEDGSPA